ncbi:MAG: hypothetical protein HZB14_00465 [Actinobacteria bacterium]|nr:hypothetical protein [Actinomycetota bacterium]
MADLTNLESKLAEVLGLAQAAQGATEKVAGLVEDIEAAEALRAMREEAAETERRCIDLADSLEGKKTAIIDAARETKGEATEMMNSYLGSGSDELDGFEFLTMAEAGEVGHWEILEQLNQQARNEQLQSLIEWALPIQRRHFETARSCSLQLAAKEDAPSAA